MRRGLPLPTGPIVDGLEIATGRTFGTRNPATGEPLAQIHRAGPVEIDAAVAAARKAFLHWGARSPRERQRHLRSLLDAVRRSHDDLARLVSREQGKPVAEARILDLLPAADALRFLSRYAGELLAEKPVEYEQVLFAHKTGSCRLEPLGVVAVVSPWSFPFAIPMSAVAACLAAGNTVVLKPSSVTPQTGLAIGELCLRAGLPPGVVNVVPATGPDLDHLLQHPGVAKVLFTGSVESGRHVMRGAATNVTPFVLELGGKDAAVVAEDADLDRTALGLVWGAFANAGQACGSVERVYVVRKVADALVSRVVARTRALRQGDPLSEATDVGPMTTPEQRERVEGHVRDAVARGARVLTGGERLAARGWWYPPTVLVGVDEGMKVMREETFGPVLPFAVVDSLDEGIARANGSDYGLTASGWTRSRRTARKLVEELRAGTVTINYHLFSFGEPTASWGGLGRSGIGRSHGVHGLTELVNVKHASVDLRHSPAAPWWYPYDGGFQAFLRRAIGLLYSRDPRTKLADGLGLLASGKLFGTVKVSRFATKLGKVL